MDRISARAVRTFADIWTGLQDGLDRLGLWGVLACAAVAVSLLLAGCGGHGPSEAACKKAMERQYATALASGRQGHEPAECKGLSAAVLQKLAGQVLSGQ